MRPTLLLIFLFTLTVICAQQVPLETASRVAENFHVQSKRDLGVESLAARLNLVHTETVDGTPAYHVFNEVNEQGFILVAGNYSCYPVVGFSSEGSFDPENVPPALAALLKEYGYKVAETEQKKSTNKEFLHLWEKYDSGASKKSTAEVDTAASMGPLLRSKWAQGCYYNSMCPDDPDGPCDHALVGCVAIAMAQVMNYYQYPAQGEMGKAYMHDKYGLQRVVFADATYNWQKMPNKLKGENEELARFLYHCAVASEMDFSPSGSAAYTYVATNGMVDYFNYSDDKKFWYNDSTDTTPEEWAAGIRNELDQYRPVMTEGPPPRYGENHAYVVDGYFGDTHLHYNWGWGGAADGFYKIGGEFAYFGVQPEPCRGDTLKPNMVQDLSYTLDKDEIVFSWKKPLAAADGDLASKYLLVKEGTNDFFVYDTLYRYKWDTLGTYRISVQAYDDCMHPGDSIIELNVTLTDTMNFCPRIERVSPYFGESVEAYPGVFKFFEIESSDPNGDSLSYSWNFNDQLLTGETSSRLALNVSGMEPGIYPLQVSVSDHSLTELGIWQVIVVPGDSVVIDDLDSMRYTGTWMDRPDPNAYDGAFQIAKRNTYYPSTAEYIYISEKTGTYSLSAFVPFMSKTSTSVTYTLFVNDIPQDTFQISQHIPASQWVHLGWTDLPTGSEIRLKVVDTDRVSTVSYMAVDAVKFSYLGVGDFRPPVITAVDELNKPQNIEITSTEDGMAYLVPENTTRKMDSVLNVCIDSVQVMASQQVQLSLSGLKNGAYWIYARDNAMNLSEHEEFTITGVGVPNYSEEQVAIFPNPSSGTLTVRFVSPGSFTIHIHALNGQKLYSRQSEGTVHEIDLSAFRKGVYILQIRTEDYITTKKVIRQ